MGFWTNDRLEPKTCAILIPSRAAGGGAPLRRRLFWSSAMLSPYTPRPEAGKFPGSLLGSRAHRPKARQPLGGFSCGRPLGRGVPLLFVGLGLQASFLPPFLPGPVQVRAAAPNERGKSLNSWQIRHHENFFSWKHSKKNTKRIHCV